MTLEAAAQLLTTALMILQSVSAQPALPESSRVAAQEVAQNAITEATRVIARPAAGNGPSCTITADKPNYFLGEVVVFDYAAANAAKLEFIPDASGEQVFPIPEGELLGMHGQYRKVVEKTGYPFITMKATGKDGRNAACSAMVHVH